MCCAMMGVCIRQTHVLRQNVSFVYSNSANVTQNGIKFIRVDLTQKFLVKLAMRVKDQCVGKATTSVPELLHEINATVAHNQQWIRDLDFLAKTAHIARRVNRKTNEVNIWMSIRKRIKVGHLFDTWRTPGCPEVHHHGLAKEFTHGARLAIGCRKGLFKQAARAGPRAE